MADPVRLREVAEETGLQQFELKGLLTIAEGFHVLSATDTLHMLNLIYQCNLPDLQQAGFHRKIPLYSSDPEIGERGIRWLAIESLRREDFRPVPGRRWRSGLSDSISTERHKTC